METNTGNTVSVWKTAFKGILDTKHSTNSLDREKIEAESRNNCNRNKSEADKRANNIRNECGNIKRKECDNSGGRLLNLLKEALHENKKSAPKNSIHKSIIPCDHFKRSEKCEKNDFRNAKNLILNESVDNSKDYDTTRAANFSALKVMKHNRFNKNNSGILDWNTAVQGALAPKCIASGSSKTPEKAEEEAYLSAVFRTIDSPQCNKKKNHEVIEQPDDECREMRQYSGRSKCTRKLTNEEKEVLGILKAAKTFKRAERLHYNIFDGAGIDIFKDRKRNEDLPPVRSHVPEESFGKPSRFKDWPPSQDVISWDDLWDPEEEW